jgi:sec-independent protein translocase protein TatA
MGMPSMPELIIVLVIIMLLFGAKKIPDLAKGMGKAIKGFKKEMADEDVVVSKEIDKTEVKDTEVKKEPTKTAEASTVQPSTDKNQNA